MRVHVSPTGGTVKVVHLVATHAFAGVERYLSYVAPAQVGAGLEVTVLGGDQDRMETALRGTAVRHGPASGGPRTWWRVRRADFDVIHAHMTTAEAVAVLAAGGRPVVATRHFARPRGGSVAGRVAAPWIARRLSGEVAISRFVADRVEGATVVVPNAVPDAPMGPHDERLVLVAQRLEAEKDTATALRAWSRSGLGEEGWRLVVAGRGAQRATLDSLMHDLGIGASVEMRGFVEDLSPLFASSAAMLATAPAEPFGLSVVEAMAWGLPVVAAAGGSHLETVGQVTPDAIFPPGDADEAAAALRRVALDELGRRARGESLQAFQRAALSLTAHVAGLQSVYEQALARPRARRR